MNQETMTLAQLQAENARLKSQLAAKPTTGGLLKVTEKGGVSVYGLGRFPVTLYVSQWEQLLARQDSIKEFIQANAQILASKKSVSVEAVA